RIWNWRTPHSLQSWAWPPGGSVANSALSRFRRRVKPRVEWVLRNGSAAKREEYSKGLNSQHRWTYLSMGIILILCSAPGDFSTRCTYARKRIQSSGAAHGKRTNAKN